MISVSILPSTGAFELVHDEKIKCSGKIRTVEQGEEALLDRPEEDGPFADINDLEMKAKDLYHELWIRGYEYEGEFRGLISAESNGKSLKLLLHVICMIQHVISTCLLMTEK